MMLQSTVSPASSVPTARVHTLRNARVPQKFEPMVTVDVTIPGTSSAEGRRALHAALGTDLTLYVVTIDKQRKHVTFRVEVKSRSLDDVISALIGALDHAMIGRSVTAMVRCERTAN